ncbi:MAG: YgdI/YgdR family lipoprotein, partial [Clostridia bacterium]|nr:YgdI/YgdR family lipoprotein [Clostridia bacterium]
MKFNRFFKFIAVALIVCMLAGVLASCGNKTVVTLTVDGKTYTLTEAEYTLYMKAIKLNVMYSMGATSVYNSILWDYYTTADGTTYEKYYQNYVKDYAVASVISEYLCEKYGITVSSEDLAARKANIKAANKNYGGPGSYKQYFGYTAADYYNTFIPASERINKLLEYLYTGDNAVDPVTDDEMESFYTDNYYGYQFIMLDMNNKIATDDNGYMIGLDASHKEYPVQIVTAEDGTVSIEIVHDIPTDDEDENDDDADASAVDYADSEDDIPDANVGELLTSGDVPTDVATNDAKDD